MGTRKENLGKLLVELEEISKKEINGEKVDLSLTGNTYRQLDRKAKKILAKFHPDVTGNFSKKDQDTCNRIAQILNAIRELMKEYKVAHNLSDTDEFTYLQESLDNYRRSHKSRTSGSYSQSTTQQKKSASRNSSTRSSSQSRSQYTNSSTGNSSRSDSYGEYAKDGEISFTTGILRKNLDRDKIQKQFRLKDGTIIYGYVLADKRGKTYEIYSENTFEELANPDIKWLIEHELFSQVNLMRANSYDVQDENSQYGYVGNISSPYGSLWHNINPRIVSVFRNMQLRKTTKLKFITGELTKKVGENGLQVSYKARNGTELYGYLFRDKLGKVHEIYSENTFEELADPEIKYDIEKNLLSQNNINRADLYNVQDKNSQYGYVGRIKNNGISLAYHYVSPDVINERRKSQLRKTDALYFSTGTLTKRLLENGLQVQYKTKDGSNIYGYVFKDKLGKVHEIFSENTFEELSDPEIKYDVEKYLLSKGNIDRADSYDVQNKNSQYGYVGNIYNTEFSSMIYHRVNDDFIQMLRHSKLKKTSSLDFATGTLTKKIEDGYHARYRMKDGSVAYGYVFKDKLGKVHEIYSENTFEELSGPEIKFEVEKYLLSKSNIDRADSYDVQNKNSQYGYVGNIYNTEFSSMIYHRVNDDFIQMLRHSKLKKTSSLDFATGTLTKKIEDGYHARYRMKDGSVAYGYVFKDKLGKVHEIYSENTFEELSGPEIKFEVEKYLLSKSNIDRADSYDVQNKNSQYGYVGRLSNKGFITGMYEINPIFLRTLRQATLKETSVLKFNDGELKRRIGNNNSQLSYLTKDGTLVYGYSFKDRLGKVHNIFSENTFEELANPEIKFEIERYLLSQNNLNRADLYDSKRSDSQYGYIGHFGGYPYYLYSVNPNSLAYFKDRYEHAPMIMVAKNQDGKQDTITLSNGTTLYGYEISRHMDSNGTKRRMFFENTAKEMIDAMQNYCYSGHSKLDVYDILDKCFENCMSQYGYMGRFTKDGLDINESIFNEIRERFEKIKAKREFEELMSREAEYEKTLKDMSNLR